MHRSYQSWHPESLRDKVLSQLQGRTDSIGTVPSARKSMKIGSYSESWDLWKTPPHMRSTIVNMDYPIGSFETGTAITPVGERGYRLSESVFPASNPEKESIDVTVWYPSSPSLSAGSSRSIVCSLYNRTGYSGQSGLCAHSWPSKERKSVKAERPSSTQRCEILTPRSTSTEHRTIEEYSLSLTGPTRVVRPSSVSPCKLTPFVPLENECDQPTSDSRGHAAGLKTNSPHSNRNGTDQRLILRSDFIDEELDCEKKQEKEPANEDLLDQKVNSCEARTNNIESQSKVVQDKEHLKSSVSNYGAVVVYDNGEIREDSSRMQLTKTQVCGAASAFCTGAYLWTKKKCLACLSKTFFCPKKHIPFVIFLIVLFSSMIVFACWPKMMDADVLDREWGFISFTENYYPQIQGTQSIKVKNTNWVSVHAKSVNLDLYYKNIQRVGYVRLNERVVFKARSTKVIDLEIYIDNGLSYDVVNQMMEDCVVIDGSGTMSISMNGTIEGNFWRVPFSYAYPYTEDEVECSGK